MEPPARPAAVTQAWTHPPAGWLERDSAMTAWITPPCAAGRGDATGAEQQGPAGGWSPCNIPAEDEVEGERGRGIRQRGSILIGGGGLDRVTRHYVRSWSPALDTHRVHQHYDALSYHPHMFTSYR